MSKATYVFYARTRFTLDVFHCCCCWLLSFKLCVTFRFSIAWPWPYISCIFRCTCFGLDCVFLLAVFVASSFRCSVAYLCIVISSCMHNVLIHLTWARTNTIKRQQKTTAETTTTTVILIVITPKGMGLWISSFSWKRAEWEKRSAATMKHNTENGSQRRKREWRIH